MARPASVRVLAGGTVVLAPLLYAAYRGDLAQGGGPSPVMTLLVAFPALPVFVVQAVRHGKSALLWGLAGGLVCCFAVSALLGFDEDRADYTGIAAGALAFNVLFWARSWMR